MTIKFAVSCVDFLRFKFCGTLAANGMLLLCYSRRKNTNNLAWFHIKRQFSYLQAMKCGTAAIIPVIHLGMLGVHDLYTSTSTASNTRKIFLKPQQPKLAKICVNGLRHIIPMLCSLFRFVLTVIRQRLAPLMKNHSCNHLIPLIPTCVSNIGL